VKAVAEKLPTVRKVVLVDYLGTADQAASDVPLASTYAGCRAIRSKTGRIRAAAFRHPLYILFSSGTTGIPKCIVHSAGGTLLQHLKEQRCMRASNPATGSSISPPAAG
jgi:acetoacetyl-CoA synthetase